MKTILLTFILLFFASDIFVSGSFAASNDSLKAVSVPAYWQGRATTHSGYVYITVYQSNGQCNSYYAIVTEWQHQVGWNKFEVDPIDNEAVSVKYNDYQRKYYVTFRGYDYYFSM